MSVLRNKRIVLIVTGGIAAYKSAILVRGLIKKGAEIQVVMTPKAKEFVTPLTLSTLSKRPVFSSFTDEKDENKVWNNHVELSHWADYIIVAPATSNTLSKMINGLCDNLAIAVYGSAKCPVFIAPAMDLEMYQHEATQKNLKKLASIGNKIIPSEFGELASGLIGEGRMAEPEKIIQYMERDIQQSLPLNGKKVLITAGPTFEPIDPVRYIGNHSSGKMGFALAEIAHSLGANVYLISGPTHLSNPDPNINLYRVTTAQEMYEVSHEFFDNSDIAICAAAVADYRPKKVNKEKIKNQSSKLVIELEKTPDILASFGKKKKNHVLIGFALETEREKKHALEKLEQKNLDFIVLNSLNDKGSGFTLDTNKITIISKNKEEKRYPVKSKVEVAQDIFTFILKNRNLVKHP